MLQSSNQKLSLSWRLASARRTLLAALPFALLAAAPSHAQQTGPVPATCTIAADGASMTCTVNIALSAVTGTFASANNTLTLSGNSQPAAPTCGTINPATQSVGVNATATPLSANCTNAVSYKWYSGATFATKTLISGAIAATYQPPTTTTGTNTYWVEATNATGTTSPTTSASVTVTTTPVAAPTCTGITPASQSVTVGTLVTLTANCTNATSYQWYSGSTFSTRTAITSATAATYAPSTSTTGTTTYWVAATNTGGTTDPTTGASVTVSSPPSGTCPSPEPRASANFTGSLSYQYAAIVGSGIHVTKITVGANDTTIGKNILPSYLFTQDDTTTFANRTVTLSQTCNDFSPNARVLLTNSLGGSLSFVTQGDARASATIATMTPGVWYINVRNDNCPAGVNCSISGQWVNWNR